jgi:arylsulfatase A
LHRECDLEGEIIGKANQRQHDYLYFEFPSYGAQQLLRMGDWVGVRQNLMNNPNAPIELFNLREDIGQGDDIAAKHPDIIRKLQDLMKHSHTPSKQFPFAALDGH